MRLRDLVTQASPALSLEFFPPKIRSLPPGAAASTGADQQESPCTALAEVEAMISELAGYHPDFMTVTYGAGGGSRSLTQHLVHFIHSKLHIPSMAHLVCAGHSVREIDTILDEFSSIGITRVLALRGDPPKGASVFEPHPHGFSSAQELAAHIALRGEFDVAVAGYPEVHRDAISPEEDLYYLKSKVDTGADLILTQLFFDNDCYFRFVEKCHKIGIDVPILPGVMPVANVSQVKRFTSMCGASIPGPLAKSLLELEDSPEAVTQFGIDYASRQCEGLLRGGAPGIHLYTLNRSTQVVPVVNSVFGCRKHKAQGATILSQ